MCQQIALIIAMIVMVAILTSIIVASNSKARHDTYLIAPYYDLTAPGAQGSPYALESCK